MKLNQRYVKVFALYFVSIVTANIVVKNNNLIKTLIQTLAGYTVFAVGLKYLTKRKKINIYKNSYDFTLSWLFLIGSGTVMIFSQNLFRRPTTTCIDVCSLNFIRKEFTR